MTSDTSKYYYSNNLEKYPNGHINETKEEVQKNINEHHETLFYYLSECDVPFIPNEWFICLERRKNNYGRAFGIYLSKMKLFSYKHYRWHDTIWWLNNAAKDC